MKVNEEELARLQGRLRQAAPPLRAPNRERVDRACARLAGAGSSASPLRDPRTFARPLLRLAACAALLLAVAVLLKPAERAPRASLAQVPSLPAVATFGDLADLMSKHEVASALVSEADSLTTDLSALSAVVNESAFAILF
jgi:hypothetical protein